MRLNSGAFASQDGCRAAGQGMEAGAFRGPSYRFAPSTKLLIIRTYRDQMSGARSTRGWLALFEIASGTACK
jgi:hypothetical protein